MRMIRSAKEMQSYGLRLVRQGQTCGFVATMGALHEGHLSLVRRARSENDVVVVSIFVNPLQFGPNEDYRRYPRSPQHDQRLLRREHVDIVFLPAVSGMTPPSVATSVRVRGLSERLCGRFRPGHFEGVATIVAKLFQIVQPTRAYFGEKDYQQLKIIQKLVEDLAIPVRVVACPTVRDHDGLALSSRNQSLSVHEREESVKLYQALFLGRELMESRAIQEAPPLIRRLRQILGTIPRAQVDYIAVADPETLEPMKRIRRPALLALAVRIGRTRLIDNCLVA